MHGNFTGENREDPPLRGRALHITLKISGTVPPESWNRFGSKLIPKVRSGPDVQVRVGLSCRLEAAAAAVTEADIRQVLEDLGLGGAVKINREQ